MRAAACAETSHHPRSSTARNKLENHTTSCHDCKLASMSSMSFLDKSVRLYVAMHVVFRMAQSALSMGCKLYWEPSRPYCLCFRCCMQSYVLLNPQMLWRPGGLPLGSFWVSLSSRTSSSSSSTIQSQGSRLWCITCSAASIYEQQRLRCMNCIATPCASALLCCAGTAAGAQGTDQFLDVSVGFPGLSVTVGTQPDLSTRSGNSGPDSW